MFHDAACRRRHQHNTRLHKGKLNYETYDILFSSHNNKLLEFFRQVNKKVDKRRMYPHLLSFLEGYLCISQLSFACSHY